MTNKSFRAQYMDAMREPVRKHYKWARFLFFGFAISISNTAIRTAYHLVKYGFDAKVIVGAEFSVLGIALLIFQGNLLKTVRSNQKEDSTAQ